MKRILLSVICATLMNGALSADVNKLIPYRDGKKCGYCDADMNVKIEAQYDACGDMIDGMASIYKNGKYGFINSSGKTVVVPVYSYSSSINNGHAIVKHEEKYAVINSSGDPVIPLTEYNISSFSDGVAVISKDYRYGLMDRSGKVILPLKFSILEPAAKQFFIVAEPGAKGSFFAGKHFLYKNDGNIALKEGFDLIYPAANGYMKIKNNNKWGYLSPDGKIIAPAVYENIKNIKRDGTACFQKNGKWGIMNGSGKVLVEPKFDGVSGGDGTIDERMQAENDFFIVLDKGNYGIVSVTGETIAAARYMMINPGREGLFTAYRKPDGKDTAPFAMGLTLINIRGEELFPPRTDFNIVGETGDGLVPAGKAASNGSKKVMVYINYKGETVSDFWVKYDEAWGFYNGFAVVKKNGKYGIINRSGKLVEDYIYEDLTRSANYPGLFEGYISGNKVYLQPGGKHYWKR